MNCEDGLATSMHFSATTPKSVMVIKSYHCYGLAKYMHKIAVIFWCDFALYLFIH